MNGDETRAIAELRQEVRGFAEAAKRDRINTKRQFTGLRKQMALVAADEPRRVRAIIETLGVPVGLTLDQIRALSVLVADQVTETLVETRKDRRSEAWERRRVRYSIYAGAVLVPIGALAAVYNALRPLLHLP